MMANKPIQIESKIYSYILGNVDKEQTALTSKKKLKKGKKN